MTAGECLGGVRPSPRAHPANIATTATGLLGAQHDFYCISAGRPGIFIASFMMRFHHKILQSAPCFHVFALLFLFLFASAFGSWGAPGFSRDELRAGRAAEVLLQWYNHGDGLWKTTSWWNAANALTALIEYSKRTGSEEYWPVIANTFDRCKEFELYDSELGKNKLIRNFLNPWWDDEGWWVLVWLDAYELTGEPRYLEMARTIFEDMTLGWDEVCGGGVYWKKPNIGKHTITNGLFLLAAIRLHQHSSATVRGQTYLQWALTTWRWLETHGIVNPENLVENGLNDHCELQTGTFFTYNQGVVLGGLVELGLVTQNPSLIERARKIATAATGKLIYPNGILKEGGEPRNNWGFKPIQGSFHALPGAALRRHRRSLVCGFHPAGTRRRSGILRGIRRPTSWVRSGEDLSTQQTPLAKAPLSTD